eukprot:Amastigsp_a2752_11.p3 type:complete len:152 gc:universal Amastigsp_a2752_11:1530-1075(-)
MSLCCEEVDAVYDERGMVLQGDAIADSKRARDKEHKQRRKALLERVGKDKREREHKRCDGEHEIQKRCVEENQCRHDSHDVKQHGGRAMENQRQLSTVVDHGVEAIALFCKLDDGRHELLARNLGLGLRAERPKNGVAGLVGGSQCVDVFN